MADHGSEEKEEKVSQDSSNVDILENGEIFFFYRPKVEMEHPTSIDDVQRTYMVMKPEGGKAEEETKQSPTSGKEGVKQDEEDDERTASQKSEKGKHGGEGEEKVNIMKQDLYRFIILGRKSLPDPSKRTRPFWCFVDLVTTNTEDIKKALGPEEYETATRGTRHKPAARAAGEGVYCIARHKKGNQSHTHLLYKLELPKSDKPGSPQSELNIEEEGSYIIQVKNPNQPNPPNAGLGNKRRAGYPAKLQSNMGHYHFVSVDPCDYLNYEGCEFILISASDDVEQELGIHIDAKHDERCSALLSLLGRKAPVNVKPLLEGEWD